jgi:hypothetical protein
MAIYHLSIKPLSRSAGRSATAAAAYRSATKIHDRTRGEVFDYTRKRGVEHSELVRDFAAESANRHGVAVDFAIHAPHREGDERNHHAHILATTRQVTATRLGAKSAMEWSDQDRKRAGLGRSKDEVTTIRERWAQLTNDMLAERGHASRVDHRSLEAQGIADREPTTHKGVTIVGLERRGIEPEVSRRMEWQALELAQQRIELAAEAGRLEREQILVEARLLVLSTDVSAATRERRPLATPARTISPARQRSAEAWLEHREHSSVSVDGQGDNQRSPQQGLILIDESPRQREKDNSERELDE